MQLDWMLALALYRARKCPCGCGHNFAETTDHSTSERDWRVPIPERCRARTALSIAQKAYADNGTTDALLFRVERRT